MVCKWYKLCTSNFHKTCNQTRENIEKEKSMESKKLKVKSYKSAKNLLWLHAGNLFLFNMIVVKNHIPCWDFKWYEILWDPYILVGV